MYVKELELPGLELVDPNAEYSSDQTIFIDFDGAEGVSYDNDALDIHIDNLSVSDSGLSEEEQFEIITILNTTFVGTGVSFTIEVPTDEEYSTIYVGVTTSQSGEWELMTANFLGLSETIDVGNQINDDDAFIFTDNLNSINTISETIVHEAGHLLGFEHVVEPTIGELSDFAEVTILPDGSIKLTASDGAEYDQFGNSAGIDGDNIVIGAGGDDDDGPHSGSAYVYRWNGTAYDEIKLTASDGASDDYFGFSVAVDGDNIVIGAAGADADGYSSGVYGSAYVYRWNGTAYDEIKLTASDAEKGDFFGSSVAVDGDNIVIGAYGDDDDGYFSGSAYVYHWNGSAYDEIKLTASDGEPYDFFGLSVAVDGDNIVIGAAGADDDGPRSGSAYVYRWNGTAYDEIKLTASDGASDDSFGQSVAVDGDNIVIGAHADDDNGSGSGSVYVYRWNDTDYDEIKLTASDGEPYDFFGLSVAVDGDNIVIGAEYDDDNGSSSGSAYVYNISADSTPPSNPSGLSSAVNVNVVVLDWADSTDSSGIANYQVQVDNNSNFSSPEYSENPSDSNQTFSSLNDGVYYWRVKAFDNENNESVWVMGSSFTVETVDIGNPDNTLVAVTGTSAQFTWDAPNVGGDITQYCITVSSSENLSGGTAYYTASTNTAYTINSLARGQYYYTVEAVSSAGDHGDASETGGFALISNLDDLIFQVSHNQALYNSWIDFSVGGSGFELDIDSLKFAVNDLALNFQSAGSNYNLLLNGLFELDAGPFEINVDLSGNQYFKLVLNSSFNIVDWDINTVIAVDNLKIGSWGLESVTVAIDTANDYFMLSATLDIMLVELTATAEFVNGQINMVEVIADDLDKPIGTTGVFLETISVKVDNLTEEVVSFGGGLEFYYGAQVCGYSLVTAEIDAEVDKYHFEGIGTISLIGNIAQGTGSVDLNWNTGNLTLKTALSFLNGAIETASATIKVDSGGNFSFYCTAGVDLSSYDWAPAFMPSFSGSVYCTITTDGNDSNDYIAAWTEISLFGISVAAGVKYNFDGENGWDGWSIIGGEKIDSIISTMAYSSPPAIAANAPRLLTSSGSYSESESWNIAAGEGTVLFSVDWGNESENVEISLIGSDGTVYDQAGIVSSSAMQIVEDLSGAHNLVIAVDAPDAGTWELEVGSSIDLSNQMIFSATSLFEALDKPEITITSVGSRQVALGYQAYSADYDLDVALYYDDDGSGYDGVMIDAALIEAENGNYTWNVLDDLPGGDYFFYLAVYSQNHTPVMSDYSTAVNISSNKADLVAKDLSAAESGGEVTVHWTATNIGEIGAAATTYLVVLSDNEQISISDHILATVNIGALASGVEQAQSITVDIPEDFILTADSQIGIIADSEGVVDEGTGETNNIISVAVNGQYVPPDIINPSVPEGLTQTVSGSSATLDWNDSTDSDSGVKEYTVEYADNITFTGTTSHITISSQWDINGLSEGTWYWRVKSIDNAGNTSDWSAADSFSIASTGVIKILASDGAAEDWFGRSVAVDGDNIVVGAYQADDNGTDSGSAYVYRWNGTAYDEIQLTASDGAGADYFGISVAIDSDYIVIGAMQDDDNGYSSGSAYVYHWNGSAYDEIKLTASDGTSGDCFGRSVAVDGDNIVIGAYYDDDNGTNSGSAYVYRWNGSAYDEIKLTASDGAAEAYFGYSVAVEGDNIVIGAYYDNGSGSAYVYRWNGTTYDEIKLTASDGAAEDWFGRSVAVDGDNIVVGAMRDDDNGFYSGSAYVYRWNGTAYDEIKLTASDGAIVDYFGYSVAVDGDNIVVGAMWDDDNGSYSGSAYIYRWNGTAYDEIKLTASDGAAGDSFGEAVAVDGDNIVIGAKGDDDNGTASGSAYVYNLSEIIDLAAPDVPANLTNLVNGGDVALDWNDSTDSDSGVKEYVVEYADTDLFTDATSQIVAASEFDLSGLTDLTTYYWRVKAIDNNGNESAWSETDTFEIDIPDTQAPDIPIGLTDSVNEDSAALDWNDGSDNKSGIAHYIVEYADNDDFIGADSQIATDSQLALDSLAVGGYFWRVKAVDLSDNESDWGAVDSFGIMPTGVTKLLASDGAASGDFGQSVAVDGDNVVIGTDGNAYVYRWNGSDYDEINLDHGGPVAVNGDTIVVGAYVYRWNGSDYDEIQLTASDRSGDFGCSVAVDGDNIVIGARRDDDNGTNSGSAYVYRWNGNTYDEIKLTASDGGSESYFGQSVAVDGDNIVIGAYRDNDDNGSLSGSAYVYRWNGTTYDEIKLTASDGAADDWFGWSVATSGDTIVVGSVYDDDNARKSGSAYVYRWNGSAYDEIKLTASDGGQEGYLGCSVAVDGDNIVVGAFWGDGNGYAYVYRWNGTAYYETKLTAPDRTYQDYFGWSVAIDSDNIVIGAKRDDDNGAYSGSAYVYNLSETIDLTAPDVPVNLTNLVNGGDVALDWNDSTDSDSGVKEYVVEYADTDLFTDATSQIVAASEFDLSGLTDLTTYYWRVKAIDNNGNESAWSETDTFEIDIPDTQAPDIPIGLTDSVNEDSAALDWNDGSDNKSGIAHYIVEYADNDDFIGADSQIVTDSQLDLDSLAVGGYYWRVKAVDNVGNESDWSEVDSFGIMPTGVTKILASDGAAWDLLGQSVAIDGDTIVIGASRDDDNGTDSGSAYVYRWNGSAYDEIKLTASDGATGNWFGYSVAVDGDTIVIGAYDDDDNGSGSGSAYVYRWNGTAYDEIKLTASDGAARDYFGEAVAVDGDTIVIGTEYNGASSGSAYVYRWNGTDYDEIKLTASDGSASDYFGQSVAIDGDTIVIGAYDDDDNGSGSGSAYAYRWNGTDYDEIKLTALDGGAGDTFGLSVAVDGDNIVIGAMYDDDNGTNSGSAYVYRWNGTAYEEIKLAASDGVAHDCFGCSVAVDGNYVVVGDSNSFRPGCAYAFRWNGSAYEEVKKLTAPDGLAGDEFGCSVAIDGNNIVIGAYDDDDNGSRSGSVYVYNLSEIIDLVAPDVPANLTNLVNGEDVALDWSDSTDSDSGVKEYIVEYADNADFNNVASKTVISSQLDLDSLTDLTTYYWRVKSIDNSGNESAWSETDTFGIDIPDTQAPDIPIGLTDSVNEGSAALDWNDGSDNKSGIKQYVVEFADNASFNGATSQPIEDSEMVLDGLTDLTTYYWHVKAVDNENNESTWSTSENFMVDISDIQAPSIPDNLTDTVFENNASLNWNDSDDNKSGVKEYIIEYSTDAGFVDALSEISSTSNIDLTDLPDGTYYWHVKSVDNSGNSSTWSTEYSFDIDVTAPNIPDALIYDVTGDDVTFDWGDSNDNLSGLKEYDFEYSPSNDFIWASTYTSEDSSYILSDVTDGIYYWRIRSVDENNNESAWSYGNEFTVDITASGIPIGLTELVTDDSAILNWDDATDNISGIKEYIVEYADNDEFNGAQFETSSSVDLVLSSLPDGSYFWHVKSVDNSGNQSGWSSSNTFDIDQTAPEVPDGLSNSVTNDSAFLDWANAADNVTGIKEYIVEYVDTNDYSNAETMHTTSSELNLTGLSDLTTYQWRVKAVDNAGNESGWSSLDNFVIDIPDTQAPSYPTGLATTINGRDVTFDWDDSTDNKSGVKEYILVYERFEGPGRVSYTVAESELFQGNLESGRYYWYVRSVDNNGNSRFTTSQSFVLDTAGNSFSGSTLIDISANYTNEEYVGKYDAYDYYKFSVSDPGQFDFALTDLDAKTKLCLYTWDRGKYKKVKSANSKLNKATWETAAEINNLLLKDGTYYLEVMSGDKGKGKFNTDYTLDITPDYFPEATDDNTWQKATQVTPDASLDGFVGFGDACDCYKFEVIDLASYDFALTGDDKNAKLTVYDWNEAKGKLKKMKSVKLKYGEASIDNLRLDAGLYYVEVLSADKGRGKKNTEYDLDITVA
jgi:FG-GAP repeat protein/fibronectin type III domain protein